MNAIEACLLQLDHAWAHKWESLTGVLQGVGEEEAAWQAPCYRAEEREEGWPAPGTIRWQVAHLTHCKRHYAALVRARGAAAPAHVPWKGAPTLAGDVVALAAAHADQRAAIAECTDAEMGVLLGNRMPLGEFLAMVTRHDAWHAGQIAVARRLWRTRGT